SVLPSGLARATTSVPMMVPAPGRFSMMKVAPCAWAICSANWRATTSTPPPAGSGTTSRMVPVCAAAPDGARLANRPTSSAAAALAGRSRRRPFTGPSILQPGALERLGAQLGVDHAGGVIALRQVAGFDQPVLQPGELVRVDRHGGIDAGLRI